MATFLKGDIHGNLFEIIDFINRFNLGKNDNIIILLTLSCKFIAELLGEKIKKI